MDMKRRRRPDPECYRTSKTFLFSLNCFLSSFPGLGPLTFFEDSDLMSHYCVPLPVVVVRLCQAELFRSQTRCKFCRQLVSLDSGGCTMPEIVASGRFQDLGPSISFMVSVDLCRTHYHVFHSQLERECLTLIGLRSFLASLFAIQLFEPCPCGHHGSTIIALRTLACQNEKNSKPPSRMGHGIATL
ncbi:hypothetical protein LZ30DRAFT_481020 [Colletotrichum cereale]|nr:hypothetical protein LZ30DRAFT_481020 [Colletotrichum cereale]